MVPIVLAVGHDQCFRLGPLLASVRANVKSSKVVLLTDAVPSSEEAFDQVVVVPSDLVSISGPYKRISKHTYYRLFIDQLLPDLDKCIYLDWDVIVLKDISDLLDGDGWLLRGVSINNNGYLNAGVLGMHFTEEFRFCMDVARSRIGHCADDQVCLNEGFAGKTSEVSWDYNCMIGCVEPTESTRVLHYLGPNKPWTVHPSVKYWFRYGGFEW